MDWKFWRKNQIDTPQVVGKTKKRGKPRDLPQSVGRHLVVAKGLDPDWVWALKCVEKPRENEKNIVDVRIFSQESAAQHNVKVIDYESLEAHMNMVLFVGWYARDKQQVELESLVRKAG